MGTKIGAQRLQVVAPVTPHHLTVQPGRYHNESHATLFERPDHGKDLLRPGVVGIRQGGHRRGIPEIQCEVHLWEFFFEEKPGWADPIENPSMHFMGRRVEEAGIGVIPGYIFSAPYEDVKLKGP